MGVFQIIIPICIVFVTVLLKLSVQYRELSVENDDLCSPIKKRKIHLFKDDNSALLVTQKRLTVHPNEWTTNFRCKFEVKSAFHDGGVMAVIQELDLRQNQTTKECTDYVQFTAKDGRTSQKFCGRFTARERMNLIWDRSVGVVASDASFVDDKGEMDVFIYVSRRPLEFREFTDFTIAFTSYKGCNHNGIPPDRLDLRPCSLEDGRFCIYKGFKDDNIINCPYTGCVDLPLGCPFIEEPLSDEGPSGESIFYGAISSLFITFAIFVCCLMVLKARHLLCFGDRCANPRSTTNNPPDQSRVIELGESPITPQPHTSATAPPSDDDKDLPPSYDSLFPSISER